MAARLPDRRPASVRIAAGGTPRDLRLAVDINGVGVVAAPRTAGRIRCAGNDRPAAFGPIAAPADRDAGLPAFQRLHLSRVGALAIFLAEIAADRATQDSADDTRRASGRGTGCLRLGAEADLAGAGRQQESEHAHNSGRS